MSLALLALACVTIDARRVCATEARSDTLVVYLHGYGGAGADDSLGLARVAAGKFRLAAPDALPNAEGLAEWRDSDAGFISRVIDALAPLVHARRVVVAGFSLGAFVALEVACLTPKRVAVVVAVSGSRWKPLHECLAGAVSVLQIHGDADTVVDPAGGVGRRTGRPYVSARAAVEQAAAAAGCSGPLVAGPDGVERASGCRSGAVVELRTVHSMGHTPPAALATSIAAFIERR